MVVCMSTVYLYCELVFNTFYNTIENKPKSSSLVVSPSDMIKSRYKCNNMDIGMHYTKLLPSKENIK